MANKKNSTTSKPKTEKNEEPIQPVKEVVKKEKRQFADPVGAIFLISIGSLFLLNNFEIVPWSVWGDIWKFWPVFMILGGLRMIMGKNIISNLIVGLLGILFFGSMLIYAALTTSDTFNSWFEDYSPSLHRGFNSITDFSDANVEEKEIVVEGDKYSDVDSRTIDLDIGARAVTVSDDDEDYFIKVNANYLDGRKEPELTESLEDNILNLSLETNGQQGSWGIFKDPYMDISIGQTGILTSLSTTLGAGTATIELKQLLLSDIAMHVGAGTLNIDLRNNELSKLDGFDISVGAGTIDMILPSNDSIGWKINYEIGLGTLEIDGTDYRGNGSYISENYDDATNKIEVSVNSGVGTVEIDFE